MNTKKIISIIAVAGIVVASIIGIYVYSKAFTTNTQFSQEEVYVYIPSESTYEQVKEIVAPLVKDFEKFDFVATSRNYSTNVKSGKFLFKRDMTSFDMVRSLRLNVPVNVAFNNQETLEKLMIRLSTQLEPDTLTLNQAFKNDAFLLENSLIKRNQSLLFYLSKMENQQRYFA